MADEDAANGLGYDERGLGFMPDGPFSSGALRDSSDLAVDDISHAFLASAAAAWDLDGFPPDDPSDLSSTTAAGPSHQPGYESPPWQGPPFEPQLVDSSGTAGFAMPNFGPPTLFGAGHDPSEQANPTLPTLKPPVMNRRTMLTPALEEELRNIAMPPSQQYHSPNSVSSPGSSKTAVGSSPDVSISSLKGSRKRKISDELDDDGATDEPGKPVKKTAHNMIEKRYRTNINDKIAALRDSVPSLRIMCKSARGEDTTEDHEELHGLTPAHKLNKATVLSKATEYIRHLEKRNNRLLEENGVMQARLAAFEKLWLGGAMGSSLSPIHQQLTPISYGQDSQQQQPLLASPMETPRDAGSMPAGVMDGQGPMKRILSVQVPAGQPYPTAAAAQQPMVYANPPIRTQHIQAQRQATGWTSTNPYLGKLMVSSLAGLMILEAVRESESTTDDFGGRGLFSLPLQILGHVPSSIPLRAMGFQGHLPLKFLLMFGVVLWAFVPSLFASLDMKPKKQHGGGLQVAPSCAAPIATRRKAWLTSIETIWVPHHFVFLEVAALMVLALKLGIRKLFGDDAYRRLAGMSELDEAGRVKAWTIALDSQLSGGDEEVCGTRLLYTLLASGSLPETPARLMLKALHIRLLLWDPMERRQEGWLSAFAGWLARTKWNKARRLNHALVQDGSMTSKRHPDAAPDHLAALLEEECDEILNDMILQRAYNLAYNVETSHKDPWPMESMNSVLEDSGVMGPLDAVAAWWSTELLHDVLTAAVDKRVDGDGGDDEDDDDNEDDEDDADDSDDHESHEIDEEMAAELRALSIDQALKVAPAGSVAQIRAILARAVLIEKTRGANIAAVVQTLAEDDKGKGKGKGKGRMEGLVEDKAEEKAHGISSRAGRVGAAYAKDPELQLSMRCAIALAHLQRLRSGAADSRASFCEAVDEILTLCRVSAMSLLTFVFVMKVMEQALEDKSLAESLASKLEGFAKHLRIWMGGPLGSQCGVGRAVQERVVSRCLAVMRGLLHMDYDPGYSSMSEDEAPKGLPRPIRQVKRKMSTQSAARSATDDEM